MALVVIAAACLPAVAQVPSVVFSSTSYVSSVNGSFDPTTPDYQGSAGHMVANSRGDIFFDDAPYSYPTPAFLIEQPVSGGKQIELMTGLGWNSHGLAIDPLGNLYATDLNGSVYYIPFVSGSYEANVSAATLKACNVPLSSDTTDCVVPIDTTNVGYYVQPEDIGLDAAGNLYIVDIRDNQTNGSVNRILEATGPTGSLTILVDNLPSSSGAQIAVDPAGDIYYADGTNVDYYAAGSSTAVKIGTGLSGPSGVSLDAGGNLYISDSNNYRLVEIPNLGGSVNTNNQYEINNQYVQNGVGIDGYGNVYYVGKYGNSINHLAMGRISFGGAALSTTTAATDLTLIFSAATTFGSFAITGGSPAAFAVATGGTCTANKAYAVNATCTVAVTYTASAIGLQTGTLQAVDASGNLLGEAQLSGSGQAPALNVDPGTINPLAAGYTAPSALALDNSGNIFVADSSTGTIYETIVGGTPQAVATGLSSPSAVVVDGAENLYVGDTGNNRIVELPYKSGTYGAPVTVVTGLSGPSGLAIDNAANLYVADSGNSRVLLLSRSGNQALGTLVTTVGSGFQTPVAVAVDTANNLYVADTGAQDVVQVAIPTSQQSIVVSGMTMPAGVAVGPDGSLYAADSGAQTIVRVPSISGIINKNFTTSLANAVTTPDALAVDSLGNLYVADTPDATLAQMVRTTGQLNFGNVNVGSTSSIVSANISNGGTQPLTFNTPFYTASGNMTDFVLQTGPAPCTDADMLATGANCSVAADFAPTSAGTESETLAFSSNAANGSAQSLVLSGTGTQLTNSTLNIAVTSPTGTPAYGQTVVVSATLVPNAGGVGTPTGTITFYVDSVPQKPVPLVDNMASISLTDLTGGQHVLSASYSGDANYASSASGLLDLTIGTATSTTTLTVTVTNPTYNPYPSENPGGSITLSAQVTGLVPGTPTGTVTFNAGALVLGSGPVLPGGNVVITTNALVTNGSYTITATYSGDSNYSPSTSAPSTPILISPPTITMTANTANITGDGSPVTLTLTSIAGFGAGAATTGSSANAVTLACSGLPAYSICQFSPPYANLSPTGTTVTAQIPLTILVNQPPPIVPNPEGLAGLPHMPGHPALRMLLGACLLLPAVLLGLGLGRSRWGRRFASILLLAAAGLMATSLSGCGSSSSSSSNGYQTPKGTTAVTVTATISTSPQTPNPPPVQTLTFQLTVN
jgi:sugar lactone lactonase YvrE